MQRSSFDTLKFTKHLQQHNYNPDQAEGLAEAFADVFERIDDRFNNLEDNLDGLDHKIDGIDKKFEVKLAELETRLVKWMAGSTASVIGVVLFAFYRLSAQ